MYEFIPEKMNGEEEEEDAFVEDVGRTLGVVRRTLHIESAPNAEQRENIFHTRCKIGDNTCNVIVDSGSCTHIASSNMVYM